MDLKELRYFRAIVEFGTFSKAAAQLRVAQPALSRQIRKLEHDLGVDLLRRSSRGVTPTAAGAALLKRTIFLENELEEARREVTSFSDQVIGTLRVAVTWPLSTVMVPALIRDYRALFPDVTLHVIEGYSGNITDSLLAERLDVAIVSPPSHTHVDLSTFPLLTNELRLVGPSDASDSELFAREKLTLSDLVDLPLILPSQTNAIRQLVDKAFARQQMKPRVVFEADGPALIMALVKEGLGYTIFPPASFFYMEQRGEVISRAVTPAIRRTMAVVTRTKLLDERPVAQFVRLAKIAVARVVGNGEFASSTMYQEVLEEIGSGSA